jgi:hypothetical protein
MNTRQWSFRRKRRASIAFHIFHAFYTFQTFLMIVPLGTLESGRWLAVNIVNGLFLLDLGNFGAL